MFSFNRSTLKSTSTHDAFAGRLAGIDLSDEPSTCTSAAMHSLIDKRSWRQLRKLIESTHTASSNNGFSNPPASPSISSDSVRSLLHHALQQHCPLDIIRDIVMFHLDSVTSLDPNNGRTALHVASASWCEPEIMSYLLSIYPNAASNLDCDRRCPLHLLLLPTAEASFNSGVDTDRPSAIDWKWRHHSSYSKPSPSTIQMLLMEAPHTVNIEDNNGMSPLELALVCGHGLEYCVYNHMRKVSVKQWRAMEKKKKRTGMAALSQTTAETASTANGDNTATPGSLIRLAPKKAKKRRSISASTA